MPPRAIALRLFLTCWMVYSLHLATNIVREIYPALALGDRFSFRVDEYANMHPDLYEKPGYGWHIGNNPGASMLAAIPYALARPVIDPVVKTVRERREASGRTEPPAYDSPWPMAREFYAEAWRRGFDVKFGLAAFVMHSFCMVPSTAAAVVLMFWLLRAVYRSDRAAMWLALLYAFGTPVFFRTGYLNHNLMLGHAAFAGFCVMWNPWGLRWRSTRRYFVGGLAGGLTLLFDYSGVVLLPALFLYALVARFRAHGRADAVRHGFAYFLGTLGPVFLLWFYQWKSFGHPFYPGQHWMPPVRWIELGYQGYGVPQLELIVLLLFDHRFGLFTSAPVLLLAVAALFTDRRARRVLPGQERIALLAIAAAFVLFFSGSNYVRLQFNTGIRYLAPLFPFLFLPATAALMRLPRGAASAIGVLCATQAWAMAMYRDVERPLGLADPVVRFLLAGPQLPTLHRLSLMEPFRDYFAHGPSPLGLFAVAGAVLLILWRTGPRTRDS
jgi:hypothetical protein